MAGEDSETRIFARFFAFFTGKRCIIEIICVPLPLKFFKHATLHIPNTIMHRASHDGILH